MKSAFVALVMGVAAAASAQPAATQPTSAQPATPPSVLIALLTPPGNGQYPWLGAQVARDLATSIAQASRARVEVGNSPAPDAQAAREAAASHGDSVAVYGASQAAGNQVRVTGQVIDANTGATLGTLNATASRDDLFPLEDQLASQVLQALPKNWLNVPPTVASQAGAPATQPAYASTNLPQYQSYTYPDYAAYPPGYAAPYDYYSYPSTEYDYTYAYPNYWWYEPYPYYGPVYYYGYWGHHHFDGDHDFDDHFARPWRGGSFGHVGREHFGGGERFGGGGHFGGGEHLGGGGHAGGGGHEGR